MKSGLKSQCKECAKHYREINKKPKIYLITHLTSNKIYIGQTIHPLNTRISQHFSDAKHGESYPLQEEIRNENLSKDNFRFEILEYANDKSELDGLERKWINYYRDLNYELYNLESGGRKYKESSSISKSKMSMSAKGRSFSESTIAQMRESKIGSNNYNAIINEEIALDIIKALISREKPSKIAKRMNIDVKIIHDINRRNSWKHVTVNGYEDVEKYCHFHKK